MSQAINDARNKAKLQVQQGADMSLVFDLSNFTASLTEATGRGQVRATASSDTVLAEFDCSVDSVEKEMSVTLTAEDSSAIAVDPSTTARREITTLCYDIELVFADGAIQRLLWGELELIPEVTRD